MKYYLTEAGKGMYRSRHGRPIAQDVESTTPEQRGKLISKPAADLPETDPHDDGRRTATVTIKGKAKKPKLVRRGGTRARKVARRELSRGR
tara:strand:- start:626 stop:898 length:273 start_codon:yes stop_codon:yes gene_type:complete